jgi:hypothetical protein
VLQTCDVASTRHVVDEANSNKCKMNVALIEEVCCALCVVRSQLTCLGVCIAT